MDSIEYLVAYYDYPVLPDSKMVTARCPVPKDYPDSLKEYVAICLSIDPERIVACLPLSKVPELTAVVHVAYFNRGRMPSEEDPATGKKVLETALPEHAKHA